MRTVGDRPRPCYGQCGETRSDADCGQHDRACAVVWTEIRHQVGDHRRCERFDFGCEVAKHHPAIRKAATAALTRTGRMLAVICLACPDDDGPRVVSTHGDDLWSAKGSRNAHARRHDLGTQEKKGVVYVVDAAGVFL